MGPWKSAGGMVEVLLTSADPAGALDAAANAGIAAYQVTYQGDLTARFQISRGDFQPLRALCRKRGERLEIRARRGIYWRMKALLRRPVLLLGVAVVVLGICVLPTRVFFVQVDGNHAVPTNRILEQAGLCGIRFGASRRDVRSEKMKNALLSAIPELEWAGVNTSGCVATISVRERAEPEPAEPAGSAGGVVAARDGIIRSCTVLSGNTLVKPGQAVKAGELLVSGYTDYGICIRATPAKAEIYADTLRALTVITPDTRLRRGETVETEKRYTLVIGKKRINFYRGSGFTGTTCVKMSEEAVWTLPGGFTLPVKLLTETVEYRQTAEATLSEDQARELLTGAARRYLTDTMVAGQILREAESTLQMPGYCCLSGTYACLEMIGRSTDWEILNNYG